MNRGASGPERLLKNSHLAAILESPFVRRSAATPPRSLSSGRDDLIIFEQPEFFNSLLRRENEIPG